MTGSVPRVLRVIPAPFLVGAALLLPAVPAVASPAVVPSGGALSASPGQVVRVRLSVRDVARCTMTAEGSRTAVRTVASRAVSFRLRVGRRARAGVHRLRVSCPPVAPRTVVLRVRSTVAKRRSGGPLLSGPIAANAVPAAKASGSGLPAPATKGDGGAARPVAPSGTLGGGATATVNPGDGPVAAFTTRQGPGTVTTLDATASRGTQLAYAWELDGSRGPTGATARIQPTVGVHRFKLIVTDDEGRSSVSVRDVSVVWRGTPYAAQRDNTNGFAGSGLGLSQLSGAVDPVGPWRVVSCLNNGYAYQPQPDGSVILEVHQGDHPGTTGGDRCGLGLNEAYTPYINSGGNPVEGRPAETRFYRVEFRLPPDQPIVPYSVNNFAEWHGKASGGSVMKISTDAVTAHVRVTWTPLINGVWQRQRTYDVHRWAPGEWQNYVIEARWSTDPGVGYFRVWRDGVNRTLGAPGADSEGRIFGATAKSFADGSSEPTNFAVQNYRPPRGPIDRNTGQPTVIPSTRIQYRDTTVGPTLESVAPSQ